MGEQNYSLGDIASVCGRDGMLGGSNGGMWIFALLILLLIGSGGGLFGNNLNSVTGERVATQADVQRAVDFDTLKSSISNGTASTISAVKDVAYNNLSEIRDVQNNISTGFTNMQTCCCETQRAIDGVNYNGAINTASINANTTAQVQKVLDSLAQNKIDSLMSENNTLKMQNMFCGIPRINPYGYGVYPYAQNGCGCNCGNI